MTVGGIALIVAGLLALGAGLPALAALLVWRRTRGLRERGADRAAALLAERHRPGAAVAARLLLRLADIAVRRRLLPWLVLLAAGCLAVAAGIALIVAG